MTMWNSSVTATIACINRDSGVQAIIIVRSDESDYEECVSEVLKTGICSGVFE